MGDFMIIKLINILFFLFTFTKNIKINNNNFKELSSIQNNDYCVIWETNYVKVKLDDDINDYLDKPNPKLYYKGEEIKDFKLRNNYVNYTSISTINTNKIGIYHLDYEVSYNKFKEVKTITFEVYDDIPPKIINNPIFEFEVNDDNIDYIEKIIYEDNNDKKEEIDILIDDKNVDYTNIGLYDLFVILRDSSNNYIQYNYKVLIKDTLKPYISFKQKYLDYNPNLNDTDIINILNIYDNYKIKDIIIKNIDYKKIGKQKIYIKAIDYSNNYYEINEEIEIIGNPYIIFKQTPLYSNEINEKILFNNIEEYYNEAKLSFDLSSYDNNKKENIIKYILTYDNNDYEYELLIIKEENNINNKNNKILRIIIIIIIMVFIIIYLILNNIKNKRIYNNE